MWEQAAGLAHVPQSDLRGSNSGPCEFQCPTVSDARLGNKQSSCIRVALKLVRIQMQMGQFRQHAGKARRAEN